MEEVPAESLEGFGNEKGAPRISIIGKDCIEKVKYKLGIKIHTIRKERPVIVVCSTAPA